MAGSDDKLEQRSATSEQLKQGLSLTTGHGVVIIVTDGKGRPPLPTPSGDAPDQPGAPPDPAQAQPETPAEPGTEPPAPAPGGQPEPGPDVPPPGPGAQTQPDTPAPPPSPDAPAPPAPDVPPPKPDQPPGPTRSVQGILDGAHFETAKAFPLPSALPMFRAIAQLMQAEPERVLLIVGHTDTAGSTSYNMTLGDERASACAAYLTNDVDAWMKFYQHSDGQKRWGTREDQLMLAALPFGAPQPFHSGLVDGEAGPATSTAFSAFQKKQGLPETGKGDDSARRALVAAYMSAEGTDVPAGADVRTLSCGEKHPEVPTGDGVSNAQNRRLDVFAFEAPPDPSPDACKAAAHPGCTVYDTWKGEVTGKIGPGEPPPLKGKEGPGDKGPAAPPPPESTRLRISTWNPEPISPNYLHTKGFGPKDDYLSDPSRRKTLGGPLDGAVGIVDDISLLNTINIPDEFKGFQPSLVFDNIPFLNPADRVRYCRDLISLCHERSIQILAGYAITNVGNQTGPRGRNFARSDDKADKALLGQPDSVIEDHAAAIVDLLFGKKTNLDFDFDGALDFDGVSFDLEINGLTAKHKDKAAVLFRKLAQLLLPMGKFVAYASGSGVNTDASGAVVSDFSRAFSHFQAQPFGIAQGVPNLIVRPMAYDAGIDDPKLQQWHESMCDQALSMGIQAQFQLGIKTIQNSSTQAGPTTSTLIPASAGAQRCKDVCRPRGLGIVNFASVGADKTHASSPVDWSRFRAYNDALNPKTMPAGIAGGPLQAPLSQAVSDKFGPASVPAAKAP